MYLIAWKEFYVLGTVVETGWYGLPNTILWVYNEKITGNKKALSFGIFFYFFFHLAGREHTQFRPKYSLSVCLGTIYSFCLLTPVHKSI